MKNQIKYYLKRPYFLIFVFLLFDIGCNYHAVKNEKFKIQKTFSSYIGEFYSDNYFEIPGNLMNQITEDPTWDLPDGIKILNCKLKASPSEVSWKNGNFTYKAKGINLDINAEMQIGENVPAGEYSISLELPKLQMIASKMGGTIRFPGDTMKLPEIKNDFNGDGNIHAYYTFDEIKVYDTVEKKYFEIIIEIIMKMIWILIILLIIVIYVIWVNLKQKQ